MQNQLTPFHGAQSDRYSMEDLMQVAKMMALSGYFADDKQKGNQETEVAKAVVKILFGQEIGYGPAASMQGIHVINGKPTVSANLMAAAIRGSDKYDYRVTTMTDQAVSVEILQGNKVLGVSTFTVDDAKRANTKNMGAYPRNMLFARAISNAVRWYCPDVFAGNTVYTPDEMGNPDPTENGYHVEMEDAHGLLSVAVTNDPDEGLDYGYSYLTNRFVDWCREQHAESVGECTTAQHGYLTGLINAIIGSEDDKDHRNIMAELIGRPVDSDHRMGIGLADALIPLLSETKKGPAGRIPNPEYNVEVVDHIREIYAVLSIPEPV